MSSIVWIYCTECSLDICPVCVFKNVEINNHKPEHTYRVSKPLLFDADCSGWKMVEELLFIDGVVVHGVGNWEDVAAHVGGKTPEEVKDHFKEIFGVPDQRDMEGEPTTDVQSNPLSKDISGYMPLREDFEIEYRNEAEAQIKEISVHHSDIKIDKEMKEALLDGYRHVLLKRQVFRHLTFQKGLISAKKLISAEKGLCATGKELLHRIKPLLKILTKEEFCSLFRGLYLETLLRKKIKGLKAETLQKLQKKTENSKKKILFSENAPETEELLSKTEQDLCRGIALPFSVYLSLKETAIISRTTQSVGTKKLFGKLYQGLSEQKLTKVISFFVKSGWIEESALLHPVLL